MDVEWCPNPYGGGEGQEVRGTPLVFVRVAERALPLLIAVDFFRFGVLQYLTRIRNDLEKVRMLSELCGKREKEKLRQTRVLGETVESFIYPYDAKMRNALNTISR